MTKWELTKWELTKWEVDQMGIDEVGIDNGKTPVLSAPWGAVWIVIGKCKKQGEGSMALVKYCNVHFTISIHALNTYSNTHAWVQSSPTSLSCEKYTGPLSLYYTTSDRKPVGERGLEKGYQKSKVVIFTLAAIFNCLPHNEIYHKTCLLSHLSHLKIWFHSVNWIPLNHTAQKDWVSSLLHQMNQSH